MNDEADKIDLSRRNMLKLTASWLLAGVPVPLLANFSAAPAADSVAGAKKILIAYYSRTGHTREIARLIHEKAGGAMVEIQTVKPYPEDYEAVKKQARAEQAAGFKPALKTKVKDIGACNIIFVGTPIWWGRIASPVKSFLAQYDLSGKTIAPFTTHGGSGLGRAVSDIAALCPRSNIVEGLAVRGENAGTAQSDVSAWLGRLGIKQ